MCVKFPPGNLNSDIYSSHPINTYTCEVTITPRVCSGQNFIIRLINLHKNRFCQQNQCN